MVLKVELGKQIMLHLGSLSGSFESYSKPVGLTQGGMSARLGRPVPNISRALKRLRDKGLVVASKSRVDGADRAKLVHVLTPAGVGELESINAEIRMLEVPVVVGGTREPLGKMAGEGSVLDLIVELTTGKQVDPPPRLDSRGWDVMRAEILDWFSSTSSPPVLVIVGHAGSGKSDLFSTLEDIPGLAAIDAQHPEEVPMPEGRALVTVRRLPDWAGPMNRALGKVRVLALRPPELDHDRARKWGNWPLALTVSDEPLLRDIVRRELLGPLSDAGRSCAEVLSVLVGEIPEEYLTLLDGVDRNSLDALLDHGLATLNPERELQLIPAVRLTLEHDIPQSVAHDLRHHAVHKLAPMVADVDEMKKALEELSAMGFRSTLIQIHDILLGTQLLLLAARAGIQTPLTALVPLLPEIAFAYRDWSGATGQLREEIAWQYAPDDLPDEETPIDDQGTQALYRARRALMRFKQNQEEGLAMMKQAEDLADGFPARITYRFFRGMLNLLAGNNELAHDLRKQAIDEALWAEDRRLQCWLDFYRYVEQFHTELGQQYLPDSQPLFITLYLILLENDFEDMPSKHFAPEQFMETNWQEQFEKMVDFNREYGWADATQMDWDPMRFQ